VDNDPQIQDLRLFCAVVRRSSFVAAARDAKASQTWVSKRVAALESSLGVKLLNRTTRKVSVTDEGLKVFEGAQRLIDGVEEMRGEISRGAGVPEGELRICSSARLGREIVAPALSRMKERFPRVEVWLELLDRRVDLIGERFHLDIRAGQVSEPNLISHRIAASSRILCAAPSYLERQGTLRTASDLAQHDCVILRERNEPFGTWQLQGPRGMENIKVSGSLAANDIDVVLRWAHDGHGIVMSADWLFAQSLKTGALVRVLPDWHQPADIHAVSSVRSAQSAKVRACIEILRREMARAISPDPETSPKRKATRESKRP
jgi:LysR family transcriptional regulator, transcriptional activator for dmlA